MKKLLPLFLMLVCSVAQAETVRVYTDYTPVRILKLVEGTDFEVEASKAGLSGSFRDIDESQLPTDRLDRDIWKLKNGVIRPDAVLKTEKDAKQAKKVSALGKLKTTTGLTDEEVKLLGIIGE